MRFHSRWYRGARLATRQRSTMDKTGRLRLLIRHSGLLSNRIGILQCLNRIASAAACACLEAQSKHPVLKPYLPAPRERRDGAESGGNLAKLRILLAAASLSTDAGLRCWIFTALYWTNVRLSLSAFSVPPGRFFPDTIIAICKYL